MKLINIKQLYQLTDSKKGKDMKTRFEKLAEKIVEIDSKKATDLKHIREERETINKEIKRAKETQEDTADPVEYDAAGKNITILEGRLIVLNRREKALNCMLSEEEYKKMHAQLLNELTLYNATKAAEIDKVLRDLISLMDDYAKTSKKFSDLMHTADILGGQPPKYDPLHPGRNISINEDPGDWFKEFIKFYFTKLTRLEMLKRV